MHTENTPTAADVLSDPATSHWLRDALRSAIERDLVDAAHDAELLAKVLADRIPFHRLAAGLRELGGL
jgi:hypothetical protein